MASRVGDNPFQSFLSDVESAARRAVSDAVDTVSRAASQAGDAAARAVSSLTSGSDSFISAAAPGQQQQALIAEGDRPPQPLTPDGGKSTRTGKSQGITAWLEAAGDFFKPVGDALFEVADGISGASHEMGEGIAGTFVNFGRGLWDGVTGFGSSVLRLDAAGALDSLVRGADKAFYQAPLHLVDGIFDANQRLIDGTAALFGPLGGVYRDVMSRGLDISRMGVTTAAGIVRDAGRIVPDTIVGVVKHLQEAGGRALSGDFGGALGSVGSALLHGLTRPIAGGVDIFMRGLSGAASMVTTALWLEPPARDLNADEIAMLRQVYGDSIDYDLIHVKRGGPTEWAGMSAHTVGDTIYMPEKYWNADGTLNDAGRDVLIHESGHVWQNQNGGGDYITKALWANLAAWVTTGDRNNAYIWRDGMAAGVPFSDLNPEQQAEALEEAGEAIVDGTFADDFTPAEQAYLLAALAQARAGTGAPV